MENVLLVKITWCSQAYDKKNNVALPERQSSYKKKLLIFRVAVITFIFRRKILRKESFNFRSLLYLFLSDPCKHARLLVGLLVFLAACIKTDLTLDAFATHKAGRIVGFLLKFVK